jgi:hypothetical protein
VPGRELLQSPAFKVLAGLKVALGDQLIRPQSIATEPPSGGAAIHHPPMG